MYDFSPSAPVAESAIQLYSNKIAGYAAGYGTILFFEDTTIIGANAKRNPK